jgi:hypothetical protein
VDLALRGLAAVRRCSAALDFRGASVAGFRGASAVSGTVAARAEVASIGPASSMETSTPGNTRLAREIIAVFPSLRGPAIGTGPWREPVRASVVVAAEIADATHKSHNETDSPGAHEPARHGSQLFSINC